MFIITVIELDIEGLCLLCSEVKGLEAEDWGHEHQLKVDKVELMGKGLDVSGSKDNAIGKAGDSSWELIISTGGETIYVIGGEDRGIKGVEVCIEGEDDKGDKMV